MILSTTSTTSTMSTNTPLSLIALHRLVPIIVIDDAKDSVAVADALLAAGLPVAEVTFRTAAAEESIRRISARGGLLTGAGTVLTVEQVKRAAGAGAQFIVSPGFSRDVVRYCIENALPVFPGVATPTEIQMALELGLNTLKFFPADAFGGLRALKAISAPFPGVSFIPTGGISAANLQEYLAFPKVAACGGSWMIRQELIRSGAFNEITRLTKEAVAIARP